MSHMESIAVRELRQHASRYLERVRHGETLEVTDRGHPVARARARRLGLVEVVRAVAAGGPRAVAHARRQLARVDQINIDRDLLDAAATLAPGTILRSQDAIHLAAAQAMGADLRCVLTYDRRMQDAATALAIMVDAPAR